MSVQTGFEDRRILMVEELVRAGIEDRRVLDAMRRVPRHEFVPQHLQPHAYEDRALPIDEGQSISQPLIVAMMTQALSLSPQDRVREIGTGSGYAAAVLGELVQEVFSVERLSHLADAATRCLKAIGCDNVHVSCADGTLGWPDHAPYDAIVVTAGAPSIPNSLREQLALGGRLVIPVASDSMLQTLLCVRREGESVFADEKLDYVRFVPLIGAEGWQPPTVDNSSPSTQRPR